MSPTPHDRPIMVLTKEEGLWLPVHWETGRFFVIDADGSWVEPDEVEAWSEPLLLDDEVRQVA